MTFDPLTDFFVSDGLPMDYNSLNNAGPIRVLAQQADPAFYVCTDKHQNNLAIWQIVDGRGKGTAAFFAFWCPYDQDRFGYTALTDSCDFMFTATMDGCSFGIGHPAGDGTVVVGHVNSTNLETPTSKKPMEKDQRRQLKERLSGGGRFSKGPTIFEPKDYRYRNKVREVSATTFGVREKKKWRFYAHRWVKGYQGVQITYEYLSTVRIK